MVTNGINLISWTKQTLWYIAVLVVSFLLNLNMVYPVYALLVKASKETASPITHALHVQLESMDQGEKSSIIGGIGLEMAQYLLKDQVLLHIVTFQAIII